MKNSGLSPSNSFTQMSKEEFLQYFASFLDADGCVSIALSEKKRLTPSYRLKIFIVQNNKKFLLDMQEILLVIFGIASHVNLIRDMNIPEHRVRKSTWTLQIADIHAYKTSELIKSRVVRKKHQIRLAILFHTVCSIGKRWGRSGMPSELRIRRKFYYGLMKLANA